MAVQTSLSFVISFLSSILIFSAMQFCKQFFLSSQFFTIFAGVIGSWFFILLLTAISNLESIVFGSLKARWFPEVFICLIAACFACSTIHRVAVTTCIISSFVGLFYVNKISQRFHTSSAITISDPALSKKKKK